MNTPLPKKQPINRPWLPNVIAVVVFALVGIIYFFPALKGLQLFQSDIVQFRGAAQEIIDFRARTHTEPLWTNSMFGGMPAYQISTEYPANLTHFLFEFLLRWLPGPASLFFLYCIGFYILLRTLNVNAWLAISGGFAFAFSSFFFIIIMVGHNSEANAIAFMPFVLSGFIMAFKGKRLQGAVLTAVSFALELLCDHPQITYYLILMLVAYCLMELVHSFRAKQLPSYFKAVVMLGVAGILAFGTNITNLWLTYDYGKYSTRGKSELTMGGENKTGGLTVDYATQWSYGIPETFSLLIPNYQGGGDPVTKKEQEMWAGAVQSVDSQNAENIADFGPYWGDQPSTAGPVYVGAIICFFAFLGLFIVKGRFKWYLVIITAFAIMLSWGKNFLNSCGDVDPCPLITDLFFSYFPGYKMFRAVSMLLVIAEISLPLLAMLALDRIFKSKNFFQERIPVKFAQKPVLGRTLFFASLIVVGGFCLLCFITPRAFSSMEKTGEVNKRVNEVREEYGSKVSQQDLAQFRQESEQIMPRVQDARQKLFTADAGRSCVFILLAAFLVWLYIKNIIELKLFTAVLSFFIIMDMALVDSRYLNWDNFKPKRQVANPYEPDEADLDIMKDPALDFRVFNTTIRPDQDSRTSYFHKSLGGYSGVKMKRYDELMGYQIERGNLSVINMLNTRYFITSEKQGDNEINVAQRNPGALGNAWFVQNYRIVPDADSEMTALDHFEPAQTAIVDQRFKNYLPATLQYDSNSYITMTSYEPNDLHYASNSKAPELAVFSEIYYPDGWNAFIDGVPSKYIRVNYVLRAMMIPAGKHQIEFKFHPNAYFTGEKISLTSCVLLILACVGYFFSLFRKKPEHAKGK